MKILLVDDNPYIRSSLKEALEGERHECRVASSAEEALALLLTFHDCNLVITDYQMPRIDGCQFTRTAKKLWPHIPIIIMSASPFINREICLQAGAKSFLEKPFALEDLLDLVGICSE